MKTSKLTIYGKKPVEEVLLARPDLASAIYVMGSVKDVGFEQLREYARQNKIPLNAVDKKKIKSLAGEEVNHQGVVLEMKHFPYAEFDEWIKGLDFDTNPAVLLLDEIQDPHNVGAIIRSAAAAGMAGVLLPEHRQAPINSTVFKTSAGAIMHIPVVRIGNVNQAIEKLKDSKFWVYGITGEGQTTLFDYVHDSPACFVVGSEGVGIRTLTLEKCDGTLTIPMSDSVESLNASVSAALVAYEWKRKSA